MTTQASAFEILGISPQATIREVTAAYRRLAKESHPDRTGGANTDRFRSIADAYNRLRTPEGWAREAEIHRESVTDTPSWASDFQDFLRGIDETGQRDAERKPSRRGKDVHRIVEISLEQVLTGAEVDVGDGSDSCTVCSGRGIQDDGVRRLCEDCCGEGNLLRTRGMMRVRIICPGCRGRGTVTSYSCPACAHGRRAMGPALMKAIPAGCEDGRVWRVAGGGHRGQNGGPNGDLVIEVRIRPHPIFSRSGSDLTCPGRIGVADAALGTELSVTGLDGARFALQVPAGTQHGACLPVRGQGLITPDGRGDLLVQVEVVVPQQMSSALRDAFEQVRRLESDRVVSERTSQTVEAAAG